MTRARLETRFVDALRELVGSVGFAPVARTIGVSSADVLTAVARLPVNMDVVAKLTAYLEPVVDPLANKEAQ